MDRKQKFKARALVIFSVAKSNTLSRTYMGVLLVQLWVALLQDVIWVADMFFDRHGLHGSTRQQELPWRRYRKCLSPRLGRLTFSLAFSLEGSSIQLNSSKVSTYAVWILLIRSLTCEWWKHGTRGAGMNLVNEAWFYHFTLSVCRVKRRWGLDSVFFVSSLSVKSLK